MTTALPVRNRLLGALPEDARAAMERELESVGLEVSDVLFGSEAPIRHVYFPETAVVSLVNDLRQGGTVDVGTVGCEGMAGLPAFLGDDRSSVRAVVQIPGAAQRMPVGTFAAVAGAPGPLHRAMLRYTQAFLTQVAQTAACNAGHLVEARCARWLLMTHDRVQGDEFPLAHEFLALMLGVRREGVTVAVAALEAEGLIRDGGGRIRITDRAGLECASCECYAVVQSHYDRLLAAGP